jgi:RNA polymerase sigma-70 factor (ECF subfamily)
MKKRDTVDIQTIQNILNGSKLAENILYNKYKSIIENYVKLKHSSCYNEDHVSDILIKIFENLSKFDPDKTLFNTWVINIAKNHMIDVWRSLKAPTYSINEYKFGEESVSNDYLLNNKFSSSSDTFENNNFINYISTKVSEDEFNFVNLKYLQGMNYKEIAKEYNITATTALNKTNYVMSKIKKSIKYDLN